jgi:hypothetical protein
MEIDKLVNRHKMYFWMRIFGKNSPVGVLLILILSSVSVQSQVLKRVLLDCDDHSVEDFLVFVLSLLTRTGPGCFVFNAIFMQRHEKINAGNKR